MNSRLVGNLIAIAFLMLGVTCLTRSCNAQATPEVLELSGPTMGTSFSVKIFDPPDFKDDVAFLVDQLLRNVNDQMSTYLKNSEISRFNRSESTDWFAVSEELASVVAFSQVVADKTAGAFDVTVGPLVNEWNFGPDRSKRTVPKAEIITSLQESVGYGKLAVRMDPPALKKSVPALEIDLSAVAKGYAVDLVVELLNEQGAENVFVEIGGEVSVSGNKAGQWWKVGIQMPDAATDSLLIAHALNVGGGNDRSMATSGDYRNYFEIDGTRYSHTIDPRNGMPIEHPLASVTVVSESCMAADAWATALNVLGPEEALRVAKAEGLDVLLVARDTAEASGYRLSGNGALAQYIGVGNTSEDVVVPNEDGNGRFTMFLVTAVAFAVLLFAMSVGVLFGQRSISGSCGGVNGTKNEDGSVSCSLCSSPSDACRDLRKRMTKNPDNEMVDV